MQKSCFYCNLSIKNDNNSVYNFLITLPLEI